MIGVLGLQGDYGAHGSLLRRVGAEFCYLKRVDQLREVSGLIIPGGESTTLIKLMDSGCFWEPLEGFAKRGHPILGTCAGMILLAREVRNPPQKSLGLIDIVVERNSYGRQIDSFESVGVLHLNGREHTVPMVFIRAPRIIRQGSEVSTLGTLEGECVVARQNQIIVAAFHPELTDDLSLHRHFLAMVNESQKAERRSGAKGKGS